MSEWKSPVADLSIQVCEGAVAVKNPARYNCQVKLIFFESEEIDVTFKKKNNLIIQNKKYSSFVQSFIFLNKRNFQKKTKKNATLK